MPSHKYLFTVGNNVNMTCKIEDNVWESLFFKKKIGVLTINDSFFYLKPTQINGILFNLNQIFLDLKYSIIEFSLNTNHFDIIPIFEKNNFYLVDSKIIFRTLITQREGFNENSKIKIYFVKESDYTNIIDLVRESFVDNPYFFSRFKNVMFFSDIEAKAYYEKWIENTIKDTQSFFVVAYDKNQLAGFFIYQYNGVYNSKSVYRGILAAVKKEYRGQSLHNRMQEYIFSRIRNETFYVENTTQLSNYAALNNHIKLRKRLSGINLIFYWTIKEPFYSP